MAHAQIEVTGLGKRYGRLTALDDVSLSVRTGSVLGVLGHNGAGKTTLIDILTTRTKPTSGTATVCGWDVVRFGEHVRGQIGVTSQFAAVDETMSGRRNLLLFARLLGAKRRPAKARADELLATFGLTDAADRKVSTYSGGMRRRLDLAVSLLGKPKVLFLDEPTTGLDPISRAELWRAVAGLAAAGTTVVLTTQYLEEADTLADDVVVLAMGSIVAQGSPTELKAGIGTRTATVTVSPSDVDRAREALTRAGLRARMRDHTLSVALAATTDVPALVRALDHARVAIGDLTITEPSLDDVYLALHGGGA
ncbi:ATP-binding cassette domain-containing protein [Haloechinothrix salitolerans]|uniref:ATP-binding cassette domain-containing protein n=1 Tax=Haloechinothrix salitolerans TaxID=926830 RepID=A0ABW2C8E2_9PSEU